jgi:phage baseplate assembly protein W
VYYPHKIFPIDTKPSTAVGISIPFNAPNVFFSTYTTQEAIRNNLLNFLLTNSNERYLNPSFGANLRAFIFQQITSGNTDFLKEDIQAKINIYFPSINIIGLEIIQNPDNNEIIITIKYSVINTGITDQIQISFT